MKLSNFSKAELGSWKKVLKEIAKESLFISLCLQLIYLPGFAKVIEQRIEKSSRISSALDKDEDKDKERGPSSEKLDVNRTDNRRQKKIKFTGDIAKDKAILNSMLYERTRGKIKRYLVGVLGSKRKYSSQAHFDKYRRLNSADIGNQSSVCMDLYKTDLFQGPDPRSPYFTVDEVSCEEYLMQQEEIRDSLVGHLPAITVRMIKAAPMRGTFDPNNPYDEDKPANMVLQAAIYRPNTLNRPIASEQLLLAPTASEEEQAEASRLMIRRLMAEMSHHGVYYTNPAGESYRAKKNGAFYPHKEKPNREIAQTLKLPGDNPSPGKGTADMVTGAIGDSVIGTKNFAIRLAEYFGMDTTLFWIWVGGIAIGFFILSPFIATLVAAVGTVLGLFTALFAAIFSKTGLILGLGIGALVLYVNHADANGTTASADSWRGVISSIGKGIASLFGGGGSSASDANSETLQKLLPHSRENGRRGNGRLINRTEH